MAVRHNSELEGRGRASLGRRAVRVSGRGPLRRAREVRAADLEGLWRGSASGVCRAVLRRLAIMIKLYTIQYSKH